MSDESAPQSTQPIERRLATILCADVASYSKMMAANEERTVKVFRGHREIFESMVNQHRGRIFNTAGDALLVEFNSPVEAVRCATDIQAALRTRNEHLAPEEKMQFRMGINLGDVIIQEGDLLGDGVNVAARIQAATAPGGICISGSVHDQIQNKLSLDFRLLGEQTYKNIPKPVRTYTINEGTAAVTTPRRTGWRAPVAVIMAVLVIAAGYWGYRQYDAHRSEQLQLEASLAAQKQAAEQAQQAAEQARRDLQLQAQKQAAEEELRRAQAERDRIEQDRKALEAEKRAADEAKKQAADDALRRAQEERAQLEQDRKQLKAEKAAAEAAKKQAADDAQRRAQEEQNQREQERRRLEAEKQSAAADMKQATAVQPAAPTTSAKDAPKPGASHDGTYSGQICNHFTRIMDKGPACWQVELTVRSGIAEASWISKSQKTSTAHGTISDDGSVRLNLAGWTPRGKPVEAILTGGIVDGAITASGKWGGISDVSGNWQRMP